ncbi:hypothetical protein M885DRAFT_544388 [Pelagophyceae sp. CCMP2097]|nr:hypothetical protein M885DRAFT_544388 [Pelagophyceae sp. CCMP2097]
MDNEPLNCSAVAEFECFRDISEVLLDMVTLVEEAWLNKVDMHACLDAATAGLKLPPRPRCHDAAREIPSSAELAKKPYVLLNSARRQRYHAAFSCLHSIVVAATRYQIVKRSKLQGGLAAGVATHVAEFDGSLTLGAATSVGGAGTAIWRSDGRHGGHFDIRVVRDAAVIVRRRHVAALAARCGDHVLNINSVGIFRKLGNLIGSDKVTKASRLPMQTLLKAFFASHAQRQLSRQVLWHFQGGPRRVSVARTRYRKPILLVRQGRARPLAARRRRPLEPRQDAGDV